MSINSLYQKLQVIGQFILRLDTQAKSDAAADGEVQLWYDAAAGAVKLRVYSLSQDGWSEFHPTSLTAPVGADYLVGTGSSGLSNEIVVGSTPGGELGGSWAAPTVDATHAEGSHSSMIGTHAAAGAHVTNGDSHNHAGGDGAQINHDGLSGVSANDHHAQSHTVASHSDTTAAGAELDALTDGTNADALHTHASGMALVHADDTGGSTSSTINADVVVVSGLSIPTTHAVKVMFTGYLNNNSGSLRQGGFGFEVNSTELYAPLVVMIDDGTFPGVANMSAEITIPPHDSNMDHGGTFDWVSYRTDTGGITSGAEGQRVLCKDAALPNATISSLTVRGRVTGADCELVIDHIRVWELPD